MRERTLLALGVCIWLLQLIAAETWVWASVCASMLATMVVALLDTFKKAEPPRAEGKP